MLVIVEYRDIELFLQARLYLEALRGSNVFQVDSAEARSDVFYCFDDLFCISRIKADWERVNATELFKEDCLSFHNRHSGFRSDVSEA